MLFNSFNFLAFFPVAILIYFIIPKKVKYLWLLIASYFFYMCWNPKYAILIGASTIITYLSGILISNVNDKKDSNEITEDKAIKSKKIFVLLSFTSNLLILFFFKYFNFFIDNLNIVFNSIGITLYEPAFDIVLPVGISFYTFQALSYTMDVYRDEVNAERNIFKYALFVSFFPQLVAGPIERSKNLLKQINKDYCFEYNRVKSGLMLMLWGYFQKLVIADRVAIVVNTVYNDITKYGSIEIILASLLFAIQIYCDFCSYSNIAIGAAKVIGFNLMENFNTPYFAHSVADFWRRWHISLSTWFRDYVYIPLGGNRKGKLRKNLNLLITFLVSGLWHGASWTFVIWGGLNGLFQIMGDLFKPVRNELVKILKIDRQTVGHKVIKVAITFILIDFTWIFFRANSVSDAIFAIKTIFTDFNPWVLFDKSIFKLGLDGPNMIVLIISLVILFLVGLCKYHGIGIRNEINKQHIVIRWIIYLNGIFTVLILGIYGPQFNASNFIYFQF